MDDRFEYVSALYDALELEPSVFLYERIVEAWSAIGDERMFCIVLTVARFYEITQLINCSYGQRIRLETLATGRSEYSSP
jgi:hypothetical protein